MPETIEELVLERDRLARTVNDELSEVQQCLTLGQIQKLSQQIKERKAALKEQMEKGGFSDGSMDVDI